MNKLTHFDDKSGEPGMVDVGAKGVTRRTARAHAFVRMSPEVLAALPANPKGDALTIARIAGIQAAKRTAELIPLCHSLPLSHADVATIIEADGIRVIASAATTAQTGVEMEALTAASGSRANHLRHDQSPRQANRNPGHLPARENRRQKRRLPPMTPNDPERAAFSPDRDIMWGRLATCGRIVYPSSRAVPGLPVSPQ